MSAAVKAGVTSTHSMRVFRDALCGSAPSTSELVLQARGGPAVPSGRSGAWHSAGWSWGGCGQWGQLFPTFGPVTLQPRRLAEQLPAQYRPSTRAMQPRAAPMSCFTGTASPVGPAGRCYTLGLLPGFEAAPALGPWPCFCSGQCSGGTGPLGYPRHLLPQAPRSSGRVPACSQRLASLLKASVLAGPP